MFDVRETLDRLERELAARIGELRNELAPLERELADVRKAKAAIQGDKRQASIGEVQIVPMARQMFMQVHHAHVTAHELDGASPYAKLTMKELILRALTEQFPNGATAAQMLDFFTHGWGRHDVVRTSLSPQLSRLRQEGKIELNGLVWKLPSAEKTQANEHDFQEIEDLGFYREAQAFYETGAALAAPEASRGGATNTLQGSDQPIASPASTS